MNSRPCHFCGNECKTSPLNDRFYDCIDCHISAVFDGEGLIWVQYQFVNSGFLSWVDIDTDKGQTTIMGGEETELFIILEFVPLDMPHPDDVERFVKRLLNMKAFL
jgi:hypothetical protein